jgi:hypothetical protein
LQPNTPVPQWGGSPTSLVATSAPVTSSPAILSTDFFETQDGAPPSSSDILVFGVNGASTSTISLPGGGTGTGNLFALTSLYSNPPTLAWSAAFTTGGFDRAAIALSADGTKVYAADTGGTLHCLQATGAGAGTKCSGWTDYVGHGAVHGSSPWVNYAAGT